MEVLNFMSIGIVSDMYDVINALEEGCCGFAHRTGLGDMAGVLINHGNFVS